MSRTLKSANQRDSQDSLEAGVVPRRKPGGDESTSTADPGILAEVPVLLQLPDLTPGRPSQEASLADTQLAPPGLAPASHAAEPASHAAEPMDSSTDSRASSGQQAATTADPTADPILAEDAEPAADAVATPKVQPSESVGQERGSTPTSYTTSEQATVQKSAENASAVSATSANTSTTLNEEPKPTSSGAAANPPSGPQASSTGSVDTVTSTQSRSSVGNGSTADNVRSPRDEQPGTDPAAARRERRQAALDAVPNLSQIWLGGSSKLVVIALLLGLGVIGYMAVGSPDDPGSDTQWPDSAEQEWDAPLPDTSGDPKDDPGATRPTPAETGHVSSGPATGSHPAANAKGGLPDGPLADPGALQLNPSHGASATAPGPVPAHDATPSSQIPRFQVPTRPMQPVRNANRSSASTRQATTRPYPTTGTRDAPTMQPYPTTGTRQATKSPYPATGSPGLTLEYPNTQQRNYPSTATSPPSNIQR